MNIKQIAIMSGLLISSNLVIGASYDLADKQEKDLTEFGLMPLDNNLLNNWLLTTKSFNQQQAIAEKTQAYKDSINLLKNNKLDDANIKINDLIKQYPKEAEFHNLQALLETLRKNNDLAIKSYQKSIALDQDNIKAHQGLAMLLIKAGDLSKAKEHANKSLSIDDQSIHAYFLLADIALKENKQQEVENILLTVQKRVHGHVEQELAVAKNLAKLYASEKKLDKALVQAQQINRRYPNNNAALTFLANIQIANTDIPQAIKSLEQLTQLEKKDIPHRLVLAKLLLGQGKNEKKIIMLLDEITDISPNNPQILAQKVIFLIQLKKIPAALNLVNKIRSLVSGTALPAFLEGEIYLADKKPEQALIAYKKGYKIQPNAKTLNVIINIMIAQNNPQKAIDFLKNDLKNNPKNLPAHFKLASIYDLQKNTSEAEKHYQAILNEQPNNALVLNNLAWLYHQKNNPKALELAEKAYQNAPKLTAIADTYGVILVKRGNLTKGISVLETASKQAPTAGDIQYHLASAYSLNGNNKQAIEILNSIVKSKQNFTEKSAAISLLKKLKLKLK